VKLDPEGSVVWRVGFSDQASDVRANPIDGGVYVGWGHYRRHTSRLDAHGNVVWTKYYFPSSWVYGRVVSPLDGSLYLGSGWPGRLARVAMDGTVLFNIARPNFNPNLAVSIEKQRVYLGDYAERGVYLYDEDGTVIWNRQYGPDSWIGRYGIVGVYTGLGWAPRDEDGDGVLDGEDLCPGTASGEVVDPSTGCSVHQLCPCEGPRGTDRAWRSHGRYVSCVARATEDFLALGLLDVREKDRIVAGAGRSSCGTRR
jgi:hypothetical protein